MGEKDLLGKREIRILSNFLRITDREYFFRSVRTQIGSFGLATLAVDIVSYFTYASIRVGGAFPTVVHGPAGA